MKLSESITQQSSIDRSGPSNDNLQIQLFPERYKNDLFEKNMLFFQKAKPEIYEAFKDHQCTEYIMCLNPDGSPNILHVSSGALVYEQKAKETVLQELRVFLENMTFFLQVQKQHVVFNNWEVSDDNFLNKDPIMNKMNEALYDLGSFKGASLTEAWQENDNGSGAINFEMAKGFHSDYFPYLRVYGLGLGYHLLELIKNKKISSMDIYEPNMDLFYSSIYTVPWELVYKYFDFNHKTLHLYIATPPQDVVKSIDQRISGYFRFLPTVLTRFNHFANSEAINNLMARDVNTDSYLISRNSSGWYEDQRAGLYFSTKNIKQTHPVYNGTKVGQFLRVFVVGNGPSLNKSIDFIKSNQKNALIFSCGTALMPLLKAGIVPDFQLLQERDWHQYKIEEYHDKSLLKKITLLKLNVLSTVVDSYYKDVLIVQKANDPGSALLNKEYPVVINVNPTVTNFGVAIAAELGANEVYLLGCDYGAPKGSERMHASNSLYDDGVLTGKPDSVENDIEIKGNFGEVIATKCDLVASLHGTEDSIRLHSEIDWLNVGRGALIQGAKAFQPTDLPDITVQIDKKAIQEKIGECFDSNYDYEKTIADFVKYTEKNMYDFFEALLLFSASKPTTREEILSVLRLMNQSVDYNFQQGFGGVIPLLINGGVQEFIRNVYTQAMIFDNDVDAVQFFYKSLIVFKDYRNDLLKDIKTLINLISADGEVEIKHHYH